MKHVKLFEAFVNEATKSSKEHILLHFGKNGDQEKNSKIEVYTLPVEEAQKMKTIKDAIAEGSAEISQSEAKELKSHAKNLGSFDYFDVYQSTQENDYTKCITKFETENSTTFSDDYADFVVQ